MDHRPETDPGRGIAHHVARHVAVAVMEPFSIVAADEFDKIHHISTGINASDGGLADADTPDHAAGIHRHTGGLIAHRDGGLEGTAIAASDHDSRTGVGDPDIPVVGDSNASSLGIGGNVPFDGGGGDIDATQPRGFPAADEDMSVPIHADAVGEMSQRQHAELTGSRVHSQHFIAVVRGRPEDARTVEDRTVGPVVDG